MRQVLLPLAFVVAVLPVPALAQDGAALFKEHCASCHSGGTDRAPSQDVLRGMTAQRILEAFKRAGCQPHHVVVDYGCGSLWIGEAFMDYLEPGNYVGLDVADGFYVEALTRFPDGYIAERRPMLRVIAPDSLREVRDRKPDFILSTGVLMHVPPEDLTSYFAGLTAIALPHTRIEIGFQTHWFSGWEPPRFWRHSRFAIGSALAALDYRARYVARHRIVPTMRGFALVRR